MKKIILTLSLTSLMGLSVTACNRSEESAVPASGNDIQREESNGMMEEEEVIEDDNFKGQEQVDPARDEELLRGQEQEDPMFNESSDDAMGTDVDEQLEEDRSIETESY